MCAGSSCGSSISYGKDRAGSQASWRMLQAATQHVDHDGMDQHQERNAHDRSRSDGVVVRNSWPTPLAECEPPPKTNYAHALPAGVRSDLLRLRLTGAEVHCPHTR